MGHMAAPLITAPLGATDTRHCGYHHRPTALCELLATCPNGGLVAVPGPDGDVDWSACLCPVCVAAVA